MNKWPMNRNLPDPGRQPTYAHSTSWQLTAWHEATGRRRPTRVEGPFLPPGEAARVMMALGRKTLDVHLKGFR